MPAITEERINLNLQTVSPQTYLTSAVTFFAASVSSVVAKEELKTIIENFFVINDFSEKNAILFKKLFFNEQ